MPTTLAATVSGLKVGSEYYCSVAAVNTVGQSSGAAVLVVPKSKPSSPATPNLVSVSPRDGGLSFYWTAPVDMGDVALTSYTISCAREGLAINEGAWVSLCHHPFPC